MNSMSSKATTTAARCRTGSRRSGRFEMMSSQLTDTEVRNPRT